nr:tRNA uridine-5-carboxymethylaminomethyl(34) synthesis GTPase MnmE [Bacteroidia bacterium]
ELIRRHIGTSQLVVVANKIDVENVDDLHKEFSEFQPVYISAKENKNIDVLKDKLVGLFDARTVNTTDTIITNARHSDSLKRANQALMKVAKGLDENIAGDLLALEIRYALDELGSITGEVTNDDLLDSIFTKFCIGK